MISWICITYKREKYLPRIVEQFLAQDYVGEKEFVILNDDPNVNYVCDHPEINIHNWDHRFRNIRTKINTAINLCDGDAYTAVGDDDLYKPWATRMMVEALGDDRFLAINGFWKQMESMLWIQAPIDGLYLCRMDLFKEMGGYLEWMEKGKITRCKYTRKVTNVAPCNFMDRVKEIGDYKELKTNKENAFFTWVRGNDQTIWNESDDEEYVVKKRNPKIITIGGK